MASPGRLNPMAQPGCLVTRKTHSKPASYRTHGPGPSDSGNGPRFHGRM